MLDGLLMDIVNTVRDPLVVLDPQLRVKLANPSYYAAFGTEPEGTLGGEFLELDGGRWREPGLERLLDRVRSDSVAFDDHEVDLGVDRPGPRYMLVNARRMVGHASGELILLALQDITSWKEAEDARVAAELELKRTSAELARSNAELERFAYVASHDLQEPLRMVASYTQLLSKRYAGRLDERADKYIAYAVDGANRMQALIRDLLAYSRAGKGGREFRRVDSEEVARRAVANLEAARRATNAVIEIGPLPTVEADAVQLGQLFQNLVSNSLKFRSAAPPRVDISAERAGAFWRFRVRDNGIGIAPEYQQRVFLVFERLHTQAEYRGTGIGLALSRRIVENHGGQLTLESVPGQGSTFSFTLPAADEEATT